MQKGYRMLLLAGVKADFAFIDARYDPKCSAAIVIRKIKNEIAFLETTPRNRTDGELHLALLDNEIDKLARIGYMNHF